MSRALALRMVEAKRLRKGRAGRKAVADALAFYDRMSEEIAAINQTCRQQAAARAAARGQIFNGQY